MQRDIYICIKCLCIYMSIYKSIICITICESDHRHTRLRRMYCKGWEKLEESYVQHADKQTHIARVRPVLS